MYINSGEIVSSPPGSKQRHDINIEVFSLNFSIVCSFRNAVADKAIAASQEVRLTLAVAFVERKTKSIIATSSRALSGRASQQQLQMMVDAADKSRMRTAAKLGVSASAIATRCDSFTLLRALALAKPYAETVVVPVVLVPRM